LLLAAGHALPASQLAEWFGCTRSQIHSVLLSLRARGIVHAVDLFCDESRAPGSEYVWALTEHASHDPKQVLPGVPRCEHCRRFNDAW
jgi:hypothetical protein